jgi:hypothetical protein
LKRADQFSLVDAMQYVLPRPASERTTVGD